MDEKQPLFTPAFLTLVLPVLSGCPAPAPLPKEPPAEEALSPPETRHLGGFTAPTVVTQVREPAGEPPFPVEDPDYWENVMRRASNEDGGFLPAEAPGAYFYALSTTEKDRQTALICRGESARTPSWARSWWI